MFDKVKKGLWYLWVKTSLGMYLRNFLHGCKYRYLNYKIGEPNFRMFDSKQFYLRDSRKKESYENRHLYMYDEGAAICYAFGVDFLKHSDEVRGGNFKNEIDRIMSLKTRTPELVVNVGCGLGMIDATLTYAGVRCIGIDPSPGSKEGYDQTFKLWLNNSDYIFINQKADEGIDQVIQKYGSPDTVILCEAIEHIPEPEYNKFWLKIVPILRENGGLLIITNGFSDDHFPIIVDGTGWCHIREINDDLYDHLASYAKETLFRHKSHLVLKF
jgi:hypothetical protein